MNAEEFAQSTATFFFDKWQMDIFHRDTIEKHWQHHRKLILKNTSIPEKMRKGLEKSFFDSYIPSNKLIEFAKTIEKLESTVKK